MYLGFILVLALAAACQLASAQADKSGSNIESAYDFDASEIEAGELGMVNEEDDDSLSDDPPPVPTTAEINQHRYPDGKLPLLTALRERYVWECVCMLVAGVYVMLYVMGKASNRRIAEDWAFASRPWLESQFAAVGLSLSNRHVDDASGLMTETPSRLSLFASGRRFCHGALFTIELKRRQDVIQQLLAMLDLAPSRDVLTIEIPMDDANMEPFVFAVTRKRYASKLKTNHKDLENLSAQVKSTRLPSSFVVLSDCPELETDFLNDKVVALLTEHEKSFISLHFTDSNEAPGVFKTTPKMLRFQFYLPSSSSPSAYASALLPLQNLVSYFVDRVGVCKLSPAALSKNESKRRLMKEQALHQQRQENMDKRKAEKKKKEEEKKEKEEKKALAAAAKKNNKKKGR